MKIFCIIFIISFIPPCIFPMFHFRSDKLDNNQIECVMEYILGTKIVKTELFPEEIRPGKWLAMRRIVPNDELEMLKFTKSDMITYFNEKSKNKEEANNKIKECSPKIEKALEEGNYISMKKLFNLIKDKDEIVVPDEWNTKLDSLQNCLLDFIVNSKLYKFGRIEEIFLNEQFTADKRLAILRKYKFKHKNNQNYALKWKWGTQMPKPEVTIFEKGDYGFEALKKCEQFVELDTKKDNGNGKGKMMAPEKEKIDAMKLFKYFNEEQLFFPGQFVKNSFKHEIECILEYILETRIVETELFTEHLYLGKYQMFRGIVPNDEIKSLKIHKNEMNKYYFEKLKNKEEANKKTEECFSMNVKALTNDRNYLSMEKLFSLTENRLILRDKWFDKLNFLQRCLLDFLKNSKFFNPENIETILLNQSNGKTKEELVILGQYKLLKNNPIIVLQWKWGKNGMPKPEETIYEDGDEGFEELRECGKFELIIKKNSDAKISKHEPSSATKNLEAHHQQHTTELKGKMVAKEKEKIDLMKLLKYFNAKQLFLQTFPNFVFYAENKNIPEKECPICFKKFLKNDKLERLTCGHYFHSDCLQKRMKYNNYACQKCPQV